MRFPALACAVLSAGSAHAASISVESTGPDKPPVVVVQGSFEGKDGEQFFTKTGSRRDQTHIVADRCKLPADVMGARTGLHADQAARNIGETAFELTTRAGVGLGSPWAGSLVDGTNAHVAAPTRSPSRHESYEPLRARAERCHRMAARRWEG